MKKAKKLHIALSPFLHRPQRIWKLPLYVFRFTRDLIQFINDRDKEALTNPAMWLSTISLLPCLGDWDEYSGSNLNSYELMNFWGLNILSKLKPALLYDIGSQVKGFVLPASLVVDHVITADIRATKVLDRQNITIRNIDLQSGVPDSCCGKYPLISCLHVIEHVGLGRYGDKVDPNGWINAIRTITDLASSGGLALIAVPIGLPRIEFNAHRVFCPSSFSRAFSEAGWDQEEFSCIDDDLNFHQKISLCYYESIIYPCSYAIGLFLFRKKL